MYQITVKRGNCFLFLRNKISIANIKVLFRSNKRKNKLNWAFIIGASFYLPKKCLCQEVHEFQYDYKPIIKKSNKTVLTNFIDLIYKRIDYCLKIFFRTLLLMFYFSPTLVTSPVLLVKNEKLNNIWWNCLQYSIRSSGPCSIKLAQWIATRPDLFPEIICKKLRNFQSNTSPPDFVTKVRPLLKEKYGEKFINQLNIEYVQDQPLLLGSGCVAQVLRGNFEKKENQKKVAIKIISPNTRENIQLDLDILQMIFKGLEYFMPRLKYISISDSLVEFKNFMLYQTNLKNELNSLKEFGKLAYPNVDFPEVFEQFSNEDILVETYIEGKLLKDVMDDLNQSTKRKIALIGMKSLFKMIFIDNIVHSDLHPGNIIVKESNGKVDSDLTFIDAGLVVRLDPIDRINFVELFKAIIDKDGKRAGELMISRSNSPFPIINREGFLIGISNIIDEVHSIGFNLQNVEISSLLQKVLFLCYQHQVKLDPKFVTIILSVGVVEGIGRQLDNKINVLSVATPFILKAYSDIR